MMNDMEFQTCWTNSVWAHATYSGDRTICGQVVRVALPIYDSRVDDIACDECQLSLLNAIESENN